MRSTLEIFDGALRREINNVAMRPDLLWQQLHNRLPPPAPDSPPYPPPPRPWIRLVRRYGDEQSLLRAVPGGQGAWIDETGHLVTRVGTDVGSMTEVIDLENGERRYVESNDRRAPPTLDHESLRILGWSRDGSRVATFDVHHRLQVWTVPDGQLLGSKGCGTELEPSGVALDRDGSTVACAMVGSLEESGVVIVWDLDASSLGVVVHEVPANRGAPASYALSDDGTLLALGDEEGRVEVWRVAEPELLAELGEVFEPDARMRSWAREPPFAFSPDNRRLAHGGVYGTTVRVWDLVTERLTHQLFGLIDLPGVLVFGPTGETLAAAGFEGVCAWDLSVTSLLPDDGEDRLGGALEFGASSTGGEMVVLSYESGTAVVRIDGGPPGDGQRDPRHSGWPSEVCRVRPEQRLIAAAFAPGDQRLAGVDSAGVLYVWDVEDGEELAQLELATETKERFDGEAAIAFGPAALIACVVDGLLYACDWYDHDVLASGWAGAFTDMRWTSDGRFVVLAGGEPRALDVEEDGMLVGEDAQEAVASAYGDAFGHLREFVSLDSHHRLGVRKFGSIRGSRHDMLRVHQLNGSAEASWPAESPLYDAGFVESGDRIVVVTVAGTISVLEPAFLVP